MTSISIKTLFLLIFSSLTTIGFSQRLDDEPGGGKATIDPGGVGIAATTINDGHIVGNQSWLIDLSSDGSDFVQSATGDLTGSTLAINIISEPLGNSILIYTAINGGGSSSDADLGGGGTTSIGQFASVTGLPDGYGVSYVENEVYIVNLSVPEVSTILPLMGMLLPWFWSRRRR